MTPQMIGGNPSMSAPPEEQVIFRPVPRSIEATGLPKVFLANLVLKHFFFTDIFTIPELIGLLKIPYGIVIELLEYLNKEKYVEILGAEQLSHSASSFTFRYTLTNAGKRRAENLLEYDAYVGSVPVTLENYWDQVRRQTIKFADVTPEGMRQAMQDLVISPELLENLGVAAVNGKSLFLHGPPGNGKTCIGMRLGRYWEDSILVPYAAFVSGSVIRIFDEMTHRPLAELPAGAEHSDPRWVHSRRPLVVAGGELTLEMLDLIFNPDLNYYEAPLQLKANNGVFLLDDFGRQRLPAQELLNRWIVPLEERHDFLRLRSGHKFAIPFDQFIIFATNLDPATLVDEAFLRRMRSKVKVDYLSLEQYVEVFRRCCQDQGVEFREELLENLLSRYYVDGQRPLAGCHPRDLLEQIVDYAHYHRIKPVLSQENLERAAGKYFL
jgi:predicted ATPase with chaperone activity